MGNPLFMSGGLYVTRVRTIRVRSSSTGIYKHPHRWRFRIEALNGHADLDLDQVRELIRVLNEDLKW